MTTSSTSSSPSWDPTSKWSIPRGSSTAEADNSAGDSQTFLRKPGHSDGMTTMPDDGARGPRPSFVPPVYSPPPTTAQPRPSASRPWILMVVIALVVGMLAGTLSAVAVTNLMKPDASAALTSSTSGTTVSNVQLDETSAVT